MKAIRLIFGAFVLGALALMTGCAKDFLDAYDQETITQARLDASSKGSSQVATNTLEAQMGGVYNLLHEFTGRGIRDDFGAGLYFTNLALDLGGQDMLFTGDAWGWGDYERIYYDPRYYRIGEYWTKNYKMVGTVNPILATFAVGADGKPTKTPEYYGILRTLRGISYYYLAGIFAQPYCNNAGKALGVPLVLKSADADDPELGLKRVELSKVYEAIIADLEAGVEFAPEKTSNPAQPSKLVALTFLAKAYMDMGDYAKALTYLNQFKADFPDLNRLPDVTKHGFTSLDEPTNLWGFDVTTENTIYYGSCSSIMDDTQDGYTAAAYYRIEPELYAHMGDNDKRRIQFTPGGAAARDAYLAKYFPGEKLTSNSVKQGASMKFYAEKDFLGDPIWLRAADPALMRIECLIRTEDIAGAQQAFKEFMQERDPNFTVPSEKELLLGELKLQRRIELWAEGGASWFDNRRWQDGVKRSAAHQVQLKEVAKGPSPYYTFPIPKTEIDKNPKLEQNPIFDPQE